MSRNQIGRRLQAELQKAIEYASEHLSSEKKEKLLGPELAKLTSGGSGKNLLALACRADGLRLVFKALLADGKVTKDELAAIGDFLGEAAETFAKVRTKYGKFKTWQGGMTKEFLEIYKSDPGSFGFRDEVTAWGGIKICRNISEQTGDDRAYETLRTSLYAAAEELIAADGVEESEQEFLEDLRQILGLSDEMGLLEDDEEDENEDLGDEDEDELVSDSFASRVRRAYHEMIGLPGSKSEASGDPGEQLVNECERLSHSKGRDSITQAVEKFIESNGDSALDVLHTITQHDDWDIRGAALAAAGNQLGKVLEPETVFSICIQSSFDENSDVRSTAFEILQENSEQSVPYIMEVFLADPINRNSVGTLFELFQDQRLEIAEKLKSVVPKNPEELTGVERVAVGCIFERIASLKSSELQSLEESEDGLSREEEALCAKLRAEAVKEATWAVKLDPSLQRSCWMLLADLKQQAGDSSLAEALELYNESYQADSWEEQSELLKRSLAADPSFYWSHNNLAWHLAAATDSDERDGAAAVKHALKACELDGYHYSGLLDTLAAAYAENGQFDKAVHWIQKAISNSTEDTSELEGLLERYRNGEAYPYEQTNGDDDESNEDGGWEFCSVETNQGSEEGRDRSYLLVPLEDFVRNAGFSKSEIEKINASKTKTWWDKGWDVGFRTTVGRKLDELGFCNEPGALQGFVFDMGNGPSLDYRLFRVHESFVSLDRKIGDLPRHDGKWFIKIYDKEEGTKPYQRLCELLGTDEIERYHWSVFE